MKASDFPGGRESGFGEYVCMSATSSEKRVCHILPVKYELSLSPYNVIIATRAIVMIRTLNT